LVALGRFYASPFLPAYQVEENHAISNNHTTHNSNVTSTFIAAPFWETSETRIETPESSSTDTAIATTAADPVVDLSTVSSTDPDGLRICRVRPAPVLDEKRVSHTEAMNPFLPELHYQCAGPHYEKFVDAMWANVRTRTALSNATDDEIMTYFASSPLTSKRTLLHVPAFRQRMANWGNRPTFIPIHKNKPQSILFIGHSHTRQLFTELVCQYQEQLISSKSLMDFDSDGNNGGKNVALMYTFQHNITLYAIFNQPFLYSKRWKDILEMVVVHKPLDQMDALVLGPLHQYAGTQGTSFRRDTLAYQARHPEQAIDFEHIGAPSFQEFAQYYSGPIVFAGAFAKRDEYRVRNAERFVQEKRKKQGRKNMIVINGRAAIADPLLLNGTECGYNGQIVGTCNVSYTSPKYSNMHQCIGAKGGAPALEAWDLVDALWSLLG